MAKDDAPPPPFTKPGDNPELDRLVAELKNLSADGDPLFVKVRQQERRAEEPHAEERRAEERRADQSAGEKAAGEAVVVPTTPAAEAPPKQEPAREPKRQGRWLALAVVGIVGPVAALAIGRLRPPPPVVVLAPATVSMAPSPVQTIAAPSPPVSEAAAPSTAASEAAPSAAGTAAPKPKAWPKKKPRAEGDAGAAEPAVRTELYQ